jgi:hypothetical protein
MSLESIGMNWNLFDALLAGVQILAVAMPACGLITVVGLLVTGRASSGRRAGAGVPLPTTPASPTGMSSAMQHLTMDGMLSMA